jgi:hypothetical protein
MNEMEVLAQILKSTAVESDENALERNNSSESENSEPRNNVNNNSDVDHQQQVTPAVQAIQEQQPNYNYNNYYNYPATVGTQYYNNANYATPTHHHQQHPQLYPQAANHFYYTKNYAVNFNHVANNNATPVTTTENCLTSDKMENISNKSKSVPDIVKELNDELDNSERRRIRNYSQNSHKVVEEHDHEAKESKLNKII